MDKVMQGDRVRRNTAFEANEEIDAAIRRRIEYYATQPRDVISQRIHALDQEWDIERVLEVNASSLALTGALLGATASRKWLLLTMTVTGFLLLHGLQGWCPPVPFLRKLGVRTASEIERERFALKFLRGDFEVASQEPPELAAKQLAYAVEA